MKKLILLSAAALVSIGAANAQVGTGRQLTVIADPVDVVPVPSQGGALFAVLPVEGIFWDERCANVEYTFNSNTAPNAGIAGAQVITAQEAADVVQEGLDRWNENASSFIEMNVTEVTDLGARPRIGGDFINEVTFLTAPGFTALASSPSTSLTADTTFAPGDDLDLDGDSDVFDPAVEGINVCSDVDNDGDIEFPAGDYRAGTILDNDVQFSSTVAWETGATAGGGADIDGVSTHEFGHSHGLNHSFLNQISETDGTGSTMFPFIDITDPDAELGSRTLHIDDLAQSAFIYPEGSGTSGLSALQSGDIAFDRAFAIINGEIERGDGSPVIGANVTAINRAGDAVADTYSGDSVVFGDAAGGLFAFPESRVNTTYTLPVPSRDVYRAALQAVDGSPAAPGNISVHEIIASIVGDTAFPEEFFDRNTETNIEFFPDLAVPFFVGLNRPQNIEFILNEETIQTNAGASDFIGVGAIGGATSVRYIEVFDRASIVAQLSAGNIPVSGNFDTGTLDASRVPVFSSVQLALGRIDADGLPEIERVIRSDTDFIGQDGDSTPFVFNAPRGLPFQIAAAMRRDPTLEVFLILEGTNLTAGPSGFPPAFLAFDSVGAGTVPTVGSSYLSVNDAAPTLVTGGVWAVELRYINDGRPISPGLAFLLNGL